MILTENQLKKIIRNILLDFINEAGPLIGTSPGYKSGPETSEKPHFRDHDEKDPDEDSEAETLDDGQKPRGKTPGFGVKPFAYDLRS